MLLYNFYISIRTSLAVSEKKLFYSFPARFSFFLLLLSYIKHEIGFVRSFTWELRPSVWLLNLLLNGHTIAHFENGGHIPSTHWKDLYHTFFILFHCGSPWLKWESNEMWEWKFQWKISPPGKLSKILYSFWCAFIWLSFDSTVDILSR
jgi:hypothetical protein